MTFEKDIFGKFKSMRKQLKNNGLFISIKPSTPLSYSLYLLSNTKNTLCPKFKQNFVILQHAVK